MRLIDADALLKHAEKRYYEPVNYSNMAKVVNEIQTAIETPQGLEGLAITQWNPCETLEQSYIINDKRLWDKERMILVTYITPKGRRYTKAVLSERGHIPKKLTGEIIAWAELPKPYKK